MIKVERSVRIEWRNNPSSFELRNKDAFRTDFLRLGSAVRPVNELLSRSEEMRVLLPTVVGVSPIDSSWQERITAYLHDFLLEIPRHGLTFDTSYVLDLGNPALKNNIDGLISKIKDAPKDPAELEKVVLEKIQKLDETELYKYVTFVNIPDYISWRYCLLSSAVANKVEDINKSVKIQFYLSSDSERKAIQAARTKRKNDALKKYTELISDTDKTKIDKIVIASNKVFGYEDYSKMSEDDKSNLLLEICDSDPDAFIKLVTDKYITIKSQIILYQWMDLLRVLPNSSVIVDASNPDQIIGNNINDAITFFSNDANKSYISELNAKYRSLKG